MKMKSLKLERFRQFADTTFDFEDINLLVGSNNSGKTSVLHAIRAFFLLMHGHVRLEGDPPKPAYHRRYLTSAEEVAPAADLRELWHKRQAGKALKISVTFEDNITFAAVLRQQFGQIHVSAENLPAQLTAKDIQKYLGTSVAFIPGLVGVLVEEPFATAARRNALATQGRYSEIFRSSLLQLKEKDSKALEKINEWLDGLFHVEVSDITFDMEKDEFVTIKYKQDGVHYDVVSSGSGLQQIIQVLTYLYLTKPRILLIDEPDAHLHSKLQARLGDLFRKVARDLKAQLFISTHSLDMIDTFSTEEVIVVDASKTNIKSLGNNADLISKLVEAGIVDVSSLSRLMTSKRLVVIEDKDQTIFKAIDKALGSPLYSSKSASYVMPAKGVGNFRAISQLGNVLSNLVGSKFDISFIQDRDGMPDFIFGDFLESQKSSGISPHVLQRHEIESYLIEPDLIEAVAKQVGRKITAKAASVVILQAAQDIKAEARRMSREISFQINKQLTGPKKRKDADLEVAVNNWFDKLDLSSLDTVQTVFPGKELLDQTLKILNKKNKKTITRGQLVAALKAHFIADDVKKLLTEVTKS